MSWTPLNHQHLDVSKSLTPKPVQIMFTKVFTQTVSIFFLLFPWWHGLYSEDVYFIVLLIAVKHLWTNWWISTAFVCYVLSTQFFILKFFLKGQWISLLYFLNAIAFWIFQCERLGSGLLRTNHLSFSTQHCFKIRTSHWEICLL